MRPGFPCYLCWDQLPEGSPAPPLYYGSGPSLWFTPQLRAASGELAEVRPGQLDLHSDYFTDVGEDDLEPGPVPAAASRWPEIHTEEAHAEPQESPAGEGVSVLRQLEEALENSHLPAVQGVPSFRELYWRHVHGSDWYDSSAAGEPFSEGVSVEREQPEERARAPMASEPPQVFSEDNPEEWALHGYEHYDDPGEWEATASARVAAQRFRLGTGWKCASGRCLVGICPCVQPPCYSCGGQRGSCWNCALRIDCTVHTDVVDGSGYLIMHPVYRATSP